MNTSRCSHKNKNREQCKIIIKHPKTEEQPEKELYCHVHNQINTGRCVPWTTLVKCSRTVKKSGKPCTNRVKIEYDPIKLLYNSINENNIICGSHGHNSTKTKTAEYTKCNSNEVPPQTKRFIILDVETAGFELFGVVSEMLSISWVILDNNLKIVKPLTTYIVSQEDGRGENVINWGDCKPITKERAKAEGKPIKLIINELINDFLVPGSVFVSYNVKFDKDVIEKEINGLFLDSPIKESLCVMWLCSRKINGGRRLKLSESYRRICGKEMDPLKSHNSDYDTEVLAELFKSFTLL
jgi:DNA polymerase III epsilon subunit-like protein